MCSKNVRIGMYFENVQSKSASVPQHACLKRHGSSPTTAPRRDKQLINIPLLNFKI